MLDIKKTITLIATLPFLFSFSAHANNIDYINIDNFDTVMNNEKAGIYFNPIESDKIFLLLFNNDENNHLDALPEKYATLLPYTYFYTTISGIFVAHIQDEESNTRFNVFNYIVDSDTGIFVYNVFKEEYIQKYFKELVFLHEIFHLHHRNINSYDIEEIKADLFSVLSLAQKHNLNKYEIIKKFESFSHLRFNFLNSDFKNNQELKNFNDYVFEKINDDYSTIKKLKSFNEIADYIINL